MNAARVIGELRELDARSGGRRVAWTDVWRAERERLTHRVATELSGARIDRDEAGNLWIVLDGELPGTIVAGSHLDCVPNGGWLDGCLGVLAAVECARELAAEPAARRRTLAVVDWADEEGARSGHSLLGSSAAAGLLDADQVRALRCADGTPFSKLLRANAVEPERMAEACKRLHDAIAYVELHIEQGPVLEAQGLACAAVSGCLGVRRARVHFDGKPAHAGATPMGLRSDPTLAASGFILAVRDAAVSGDGLATVGVLEARPGTPTAIAESVDLVVDVRHADADALERLDRQIASLAQDAARNTGCVMTREAIWSIDPIAFDERLVGRAASLTGGEPLVSGPLHDAAAVAKAGVPTAMLFVRTRDGVSHSRAEDAREDDLARALEAFAACIGELVRPTEADACAVSPGGPF